MVGPGSWLPWRDGDRDRDRDRERERERERERGRERGPTIHVIMMFSLTQGDLCQ